VTRPSEPSQDLPKVAIIGIGDDGLEGLTRAAQQQVLSAPIVITPRMFEGQLREATGRVVELPSSLEQLVRLVEQLTEPAVMLSSGDPLFFGVARYLCQHLGKERFEIWPHVSSMQLAFARVRESWDEAYLTSLGTQPLELVLERIRTAEKVGLFPTAEITPSVLCRMLLDRGIDYFQVSVCENLGSPDERLTRGSLSDMVGQTFSAMNVTILLRDEGAADRALSEVPDCLLGVPDEAFLQSIPKRGLLTPVETRAIALAEMRLRPESVVWDVGAGSGSVAIEASRVAFRGRVYAVEMDVQDYQLLVENAKRFAASRVFPVHGEAPHAWAELPTPDAIFIGGTGRSVAGLCQQAWPQLREGGRLVVSLSSIENLSAINQLARDDWGVEPEVRLLQIARGNSQFDQLRFESLSPSFLISVEKPQDGE
jgi:precorrin-6Y C5,15-methyltransferase (decarboxylating)